MKKLYLSIFVLTVIFFSKGLYAQETQNLSKSLPLSTTTPVPNTSTPTHTATFTYTPTATYTPTVTYTPTKSQTPTSVFNCIYAVMGDSWVCGDGASSRPASTFAYLTSETLKNWYPGIIYENDCNPGSPPEFWIDEMPQHLNTLSKKNGLPIGYVVFVTGSTCSFNLFNLDHLGDSDKNASLSENISQKNKDLLINEIYAPHPDDYKKVMDKIIGEIYAVNPNVNLVILDIADRSGGTGKWAPPAVYESYRQRLYDLKSKYPKMRIADIYTAMKGHPEWFKSHYAQAQDHPNDLGYAAITKCILAQFANWPYRPPQH